jgi:hypothetical protein
MTPMEQLARLISTFPGVLVEETCDADEGYVQFKCSSELSLAHIMASTQETDANEGLSITEWNCIVHCDHDYATVFYILYAPENRVIRNRDALVLATKYKNYYEEYYDKQLIGMQDPNGLGVPDLSYVTVAQMTAELGRRQTKFALVWRDGRTGKASLDVGGGPNTVKNLLREAWRIVKERLNPQEDE